MVIRKIIVQSLGNLHQYWPQRIEINRFIECRQVRETRIQFCQRLFENFKTSVFHFNTRKRAMDRIYRIADRINRIKNKIT